MASLISFLLPALLLGSSWLGWRVQLILPERHRSRDSIEAIRLVMTMLVTFAALVMGLLTSGAKTRYDAHDANLTKYSIDLIQLDQTMREYGDELAGPRMELRAYTAAAIADTWPDQSAPPGRYPTHLTAPTSGGFERRALGDMLLDVSKAITRLVPADVTHTRLAATLQQQMGELVQQRWILVQSARSAFSWPFMAVMVIWLIVIFAIFGLSAPANRAVYAVIGLGVLSVTLALVVIIEFDTPLTGLIRVSSAAMRDALAHMDQP